MRQRLSLPGRVRPSTFRAEELNFCVRYENRWDLLAIATAMVYSVFCFKNKATGNIGFLSAKNIDNRIVKSKSKAWFNCNTRPNHQNCDQALDLLVSVS